MHVIAAKAVCFLEAMTPEFRAYSQQVIANAQVLAESLQQEGFRVVSGGTDTHLLLVDVFAKGRSRQGSRDGAGRSLHHREQERDSVRRESAAESERHPAGQSGGDHARFPRGGDAAGGGADRRGAERRAIRLQVTETLLAVRRRVTELAERFPLYPWKLARATA